MDREQLRRSAIRAYELGRVRAASRAAWLVVPAVATCALATGPSGGADRCVCVGVVLLVAAVFLRWRSRRGADAARAGLAAGALPMIAGLVVSCAEPDWREAPLLSACTAICASVGAAGGAWLGHQLQHRAASLWMWWCATGIAVLVSTLGCVSLGLGGIVGAAAGLVTAGAAARFVGRW